MDAALLQKWNFENSMVTAWLVNSPCPMKPSIKETYLFLSTARDVWDTMKEIYSDFESASQIFEIKTRLWPTKQGSREVTEHYMKMVNNWQELYLSLGEKWECLGDRSRYKKEIGNERVYEFLAALNHE